MGANHTNAGRGQERLPLVSIIIPARNEEACLADCLASLVSQTGIDFEIIVVNDNSTDETRDIALSFATVTVVDAPPLPPGWTGKCHALHCGVQVARGKWFLFTDADTMHMYRSLRRAVDEADEYGADLLSYSPKQVVDGFWERALMPVVFAELRRQYPPREVSNPNSTAAAANGQYLLITRDLYYSIGGHAAVRDSLLEDVDLARLAKKAGATIRFRYGRKAVKTRMYRSFGQMWEGWTKNLAVLFPSTFRLALDRGAEFLFAFGGIFLAAWAESRYMPRTAMLGLGISVAVFADFYRRVRNAHFGWVNTFIAPAGLPLFVILLLRSRSHHLQKRVVWKGRAYRPAAPIDTEASSPATSAMSASAK